jgi:hypothetical protein
MRLRFLTPDRFAVVAMILVCAALLVGGQFGVSAIGDICCIISIVAAYVAALHAAYRAIDLGLVP